jgi:RNA polymerase sigma factor (sigma-70 family)
MEPSDGSRPLPPVEDLVRRAQRGDTLAMNQLLDLLLPRLGRICVAIALDDGPDALQECAIQILRGLPQLREPAALWSWARRIATHEAVRQAQRRPPVALAAEPSVSDATAERLEVRAQLAQLPADHRAILVLRDLEGLEESEVAELLGVALGTVKSRLHRARQAFRAGWEA